MKIVTVSQMQKAERDCSQYDISLSQLMDNAGKTVAQEVKKILGELPDSNLLILAGPGNNGGDGLVAARYLYDWGIGRVKILLCGKRMSNDPVFVEVLKRGIHHRDLENDYNLSKFNEWLSEADAVLDAFFGTGKSRALGGIYTDVLKGIKEARRQRDDLTLIALDLPSGTNADTGEVDLSTPNFDYTITLGFPKVGLYNLPAAEKAGKIIITDIGIPPQLAEGVETELMTDDRVADFLPARPAISHKGTFGRVLAVTGSINYPGAACLSCHASLRAGAGLTTLACAPSLLPIVAARLAEVTYLPLPEFAHGIMSTDSLKILRSAIPQYSVILAGCGVGQSQSVKETLKGLLLDSPFKLPPVILDADGINILAEHSDWPEKFKNPAVFTPHAAEMSRLLGKTVTEIQNNRQSIAREAAASWNKVIVIKGAYTVIADPDGRVLISPFANAALASAGTGDVLAGTIAGLAAQGLPLFEAAACGVYLHGLAAEMATEELGNAGMMAGDLLPLLPKAIKHLKGREYN
jgi:NAD(P)H-hydrate epimerase